MHEVMIEPSEEFLAERRDLGLDSRDEVWDGVLHVVPPAATRHQLFESDLEAVLRGIAKTRGLVVLHQAGVFEPGRPDFKNFRVPDLAVVDPRFLADRGIEGRAEIVIEVLSPRDQSREKFEFYTLCGVTELWLVDPHTRAVEIYALRSGRYERLTRDAAGIIQAPALALELSIVDGPQLRITWATGSEEI